MALGTLEADGPHGASTVRDRVISRIRSDVLRRRLAYLALVPMARTPLGRHRTVDLQVRPGLLSSRRDRRR